MHSERCMSGSARGRAKPLVARPEWRACPTQPYIPTTEGWLYLAGIKDLCTGEVVGYAMGARMTTDLVQEALRKALDTKRPAPGLIHHSDRGSQYCAQDYQAQLRQFGLTPSMRRKGNC